MRTNNAASTVDIIFIKDNSSGVLIDKINAVANEFYHLLLQRYPLRSSKQG